jgi:hypothetical protein
MKIARLFVIITAVLLMLSLSVACGGGSTSAPEEQNQPENVQESGSTEAQAPESVGDTQPTEVEQPNEPAMPGDVPIMENIRDFQATSDFTNISYVVDLDINDVVAWYQEQLPNYNWEMSRAPDSALASIANMSRINANNDRLTISLQHNPVGEFTVVRIVVVRSQ